MSKKINTSKSPNLDDLISLKRAAELSGFSQGHLSLLMSAGVLSGLGLFMLGWILMSVSTLLANVFPRWAALSTIAGLILIPALGVTSLDVAGQVIGNVVFGLGLAGMGYAVARRDDNVISP